MSGIDLTVETDIGYDSIPIPDRMVLPIQPGRVGLFKYKQHESEPFSVEHVNIVHAGGNRVKISMVAAGRLDISTFPDPNFDGAEIEVEGGFSINDLHLQAHGLQLKRLDLRKVPSAIDELIRRILDKYLMTRLTDVLHIDLEPELNKAMYQLNRPNPFKIKFGKREARYQFCAGVHAIEPKLQISPSGFHIKFNLRLSPNINTV